MDFSLNNKEPRVLQGQTSADGAIFRLDQLWLQQTAGHSRDKAPPLAGERRKDVASPAFLLEGLKTSTPHPAAAAPRLQLLVDVDASDADVSIEIEEGVFLCAPPVGEADDRAVRQLYQELCRGEFDDHLEQKGRGRRQEVRQSFHILSLFCRLGIHLELLALTERKAALPHLLVPAAPLVGVAHHLVFVSVGVEAGVQVHGDLLLVLANIDRKAAAQR